ncbi:MAG: hypothetical protein KA004_02755 [Verrucomicrobiales bacterium]|nr:hypothetical protein [Verrucomicrobiales bacterium]
MKTTVLLTATLLLTSFALHAVDKKKKPAAEKSTSSENEKPATPPESNLSKEQSVLKTALENHARLKGFHVDVVIKTDEGSATLKGALGEKSLALDCTDVKGVKKQRVVAGGEFFLSLDGGKTWQTGKNAEKETTLIFNNIITAPLALSKELLKGDYTATEEKLDGEEVLHLEKPAKGKNAAMNIWLCRERNVNNMIFLRKVEMIVSGDGLDLPATIVYSKLSEPVKIDAPGTK